MNNYSTSPSVFFGQTLHTRQLLLRHWESAAFFKVTKKWRSIWVHCSLFYPLKGMLHPRWIAQISMLWRKQEKWLPHNSFPLSPGLVHLLYLHWGGRPLKKKKGTWSRSSGREIITSMLSQQSLGLRWQREMGKVLLNTWPDIFRQKLESWESCESWWILTGLLGISRACGCIISCSTLVCSRRMTPD